MKKAAKVLEAELIQANKSAKEVDALLRKEQGMTSTLQAKLKKEQETRLSDNTRLQKQIQDLLKEKTSLQTALNKSKKAIKKVEELINFFTTEILKQDGTFPKLKWYNIGLILKIIGFLVTFIPEIIAIFKNGSPAKNKG